MALLVAAPKSAVGWPKDIRLRSWWTLFYFSCESGISVNRIVFVSVNEKSKLLIFVFR